MRRTPRVGGTSDSRIRRSRHNQNARRSGNSSNSHGHASGHGHSGHEQGHGGHGQGHGGHGQGHGGHGHGHGSSGHGHGSGSHGHGSGSHGHGSGSHGHGNGSHGHGSGGHGHGHGGQGNGQGHGQNGGGHGSGSDNGEVSFENMVHAIKAKHLNGEIVVAVQFQDRRIKIIQSLDELAVYIYWNANQPLDDGDRPHFCHELALVTDFLMRPNVRITGARNCFDKAFPRRSSGYCTIAAPHGVLYYQEDTPHYTCGTLGGLTGNGIQGRKAHISAPRYDSRGLATNAILLQADTIYQIAGLDEEAENLENPSECAQDDNSQQVDRLLPTGPSYVFNQECMNQLHPIDAHGVVRPSWLQIASKNGEDQTDLCAACHAILEIDYAAVVPYCGDASCSLFNDLDVDS